MSGPQFIEGEWTSNSGGYTLTIGELFVAHIEQQGGASIYRDCWTVSLNGNHVPWAGGSDRLYNERLAEYLILSEVKRLAPVFRRLKDRAPPHECFSSQDSYARWMQWKAERGLPPYDKKTVK